MTIWLKILSIFADIYQFIKKHPKLLVAIILAIFIILFFKQCDDNRRMKTEIEQLEVEIKNEQNRFLNNYNAINDTVVKIKGTNTYLKGVVRIKEDETQVLNNRLRTANNQVKDLTKKLKDAKVQSVYVADISSSIKTTDVLTNFNESDSNVFSVGIKDSNQVYSIETETWFRVVPFENKFKLELFDKFNGSSSLLKHDLNFTLTMAQIQLPDGNTRVLIRPTDRFGNEIPESLLKIPFADGANFMDVKPQTITPPSDKKKRTGFGIAIGPQAGLFYNGQSFVPGLGIGINVGYRIF